MTSLLSPILAVEAGVGSRWAYSICAQMKHTYMHTQMHRMLFRCCTWLSQDDHWGFTRSELLSYALPFSLSCSFFLLAICNIKYPCCQIQMHLSAWPVSLVVSYVSRGELNSPVTLPAPRSKGLANTLLSPFISLLLFSKNVFIFYIEMREKGLIFDIVSHPPAVVQVKETDGGIRG